MWQFIVFIFLPKQILICFCFSVKMWRYRIEQNSSLWQKSRKKEINCSIIILYPSLLRIAYVYNGDSWQKLRTIITNINCFDPLLNLPLLYLFKLYLKSISTSFFLLLVKGVEKSVQTWSQFNSTSLLRISDVFSDGL